MNMVRIKRQDGVALFMSLVMLLILTLLGLSSVQMTSMQERMSRNARDSNLAFQGAESAIKTSEVYLETVTTLLPFQDNNSNGRYDATDDGDGPVILSSIDWTDSTTNPDCIINSPCAGHSGFESVDIVIGSVVKEQKYIIEFIKTVVSDEDRLNLDNIGQDTGSGRTQVFRITSYGTGGTDTAHVMIQSTYGKRF